MEDAATEDLSLVPTKEFFKPVLVISAPITPEMAEILNIAWVFDSHGNPQRFEGAVKLAEGELSGPTLTLAGKVTAPVEIKTEKIAHFAVFKVEDALHLRMRAHLQDKGVEGIVSLLEFLAALNKQPYTATVIEAQGSLLQMSGLPKPDENGMYDEKPAIVRSTSYRIGRAPHGIKARVLSLAIDGGYIGGWSCNAEAIKDAPDHAKFGGVPLSDQSTVYASEEDAVSRAKLSLEKFVTALQQDIANPQEKKAVEQLLEWCGSKAAPTPFEVGVH